MSTGIIAQLQPLIEVFSDTRTFASRVANAILTCCAMVCGYGSASAIVAWGRNDGTDSAQALGFTHNTPCFQGERGRQLWPWDNVSSPAMPVKL
jgi:hypothetical protein